MYYFVKDSKKRFFFESKSLRKKRLGLKFKSFWDDDSSLRLGLGFEFES